MPLPVLWWYTEQRLETRVVEIVSWFLMRGVV